ncbi:hypothetical protein [Streptomyces sp. NPDC056723]|uniref:hypothetical protein n=1 Tax=Streptomyces sp. NPDC056723 TaxID=3345925 RepID=UPI003677A949
MTEPTLEDIAAMRADGSLREYFQFLTGRTPKPQPAAEPESTEPGYRIAHPGGWPIGTAATGPTPTHGRCACIKCERAAVVQLPTVRLASESEAA